MFQSPLVLGSETCLTMRCVAAWDVAQASIPLSEVLLFLGQLWCSHPWHRCARLRRARRSVQRLQPQGAGFPFHCVGCYVCREFTLVSPLQMSLPLPRSVQIDWEAILTSDSDDFVASVRVRLCCIA